MKDNDQAGITVSSCRFCSSGDAQVPPSISLELFKNLFLFKVLILVIMKTQTLQADTLFLSELC